MLPAEPLPVRLMNTVWADRFRVHDDLASPDDLDAWLVDVGLAATAPANPANLGAAVDLRDGVRRLAALVTHDDRPRAATAGTDVATAVERLNDIARHGTPAPRLLERGGLLEREDPGPSRLVETALGAVAVAAIDLLAGPSAARLRACHAPGCVLYFVHDHPRREWCSVTCGNRARAARHYRRHAPAGTKAGSQAGPSGGVPH